MSTASSVLQQLIPPLLETVSSFRELLAQESETLAAGHIDQLPALTDRKLELAEKLELLERERQTVLQQLGSGNFDLEAMASALQDAANAQDLLRQWQSAVAMLNDCMQLNAQTSAALRTQSQYTQRALEVLAGGLALPVTYGPDGQNGISPPGHRLGKA